MSWTTIGILVAAYIAGEVIMRRKAAEAVPPVIPPPLPQSPEDEQFQKIKAANELLKGLNVDKETRANLLTPLLPQLLADKPAAPPSA